MVAASNKPGTAVVAKNRYSLVMPAEHVAGAPVNGAARSGKRWPHLQVFSLWCRGCGLRKQVTRRPAQKHTYCVTTSAVKNLMRHVHSVFMARLA